MRNENQLNSRQWRVNCDENFYADDGILNKFSSRRRKFYDKLQSLFPQKPNDRLNE